MTIVEPPKKPASKDWHRAQIVAAIWMKKSSLHRLSRQHGYTGPALANALRFSWPKAERIIAEFIGVSPQEIWPSRYNADGTAASGRGERGRTIKRLARNHSTAGIPKLPCALRRKAA